MARHWGIRLIPFDKLPDRLGPIPEFHPMQVPVAPVVNTSGMVKDMAEQIGQIANYMSPFERQKRQLEMQALQMKNKMFADYRAHPDQYEITPNGNIRKKDPFEALKMTHTVLSNLNLQKELDIRKGQLAKQQNPAVDLIDHMRKGQQSVTGLTPGVSNPASAPAGFDPANPFGNVSQVTPVAVPIGSGLPMPEEEESNSSPPEDSENE